MEISQNRLFVDPLQLKPIRLSVGTVQWLARELKVSKASPLVPLLAVTGAAAESSKELNELDIPHAKQGNVVSSSRGKLYRLAVEVLAAPEALLMLSEVLEGQPPLSLRIVLGRGQAVLASIDEAGLNLSPPLPYRDLLKALSRHFENTTQTATERSFWPAQLKTLTFVFSNARGSLEATATGAAVTERFTHAEVTEEERRAAIDELAAGGFIENRLPKEIALTPNTAFWLNRLATGQLAELLVVVYDEQGNASPSAQQLRFAGPLKDRVTVLTVSGEELKRLAGATPAEPNAVCFSVVPPERMEPMLEAFLGLPRA